MFGGPLPKTIYMISSSVSPDILKQAKSYFNVNQLLDAFKIFIDLVNTIDNGATAGGYVTLARLPDSIYPDGLTLHSWTKGDKVHVYVGGKTDLFDILLS